LLYPKYVQTLLLIKPSFVGIKIKKKLKRTDPTAPSVEGNRLEFWILLPEFSP